MADLTSRDEASYVIRPQASDNFFLSQPCPQGLLGIFRSISNHHFEKNLEGLGTVLFLSRSEYVRRRVETQSLYPWIDSYFIYDWGELLRTRGRNINCACVSCCTDSLGIPLTSTITCCFNIYIFRFIYLFVFGTIQNSKR